MEAQLFHVFLLFVSTPDHPLCNIEAIMWIGWTQSGRSFIPGGKILENHEEASGCLITLSHSNFNQPCMSSLLLTEDSLGLFWLSGNNSTARVNKDPRFQFPLTI